MTFLRPQTQCHLSALALGKWWLVGPLLVAWKVPRPGPLLCGTLRESPVTATPLAALSGVPVTTMEQTSEKQPFLDTTDIGQLKGLLCLPACQVQLHAPCGGCHAAPTSACRGTPPG